MTAAESAANQDAPRAADAAIQGHGDTGAWRHRLSHVRLWGLTVVGLVLDLTSKHMAFDRLTPGGASSPSLIPGVVRLELSLNPGALFGMGSGQAWLFIVASIAALGFVLYMFVGSGRRQRLVHVGLGLILAGALGNLYDRTFIRYDLLRVKTGDGGPSRAWFGQVLGDPDAEIIEARGWGRSGRLTTFNKADLDGPVQRVGMVRDFLKFEPIAGWDYWPWVFNVADVCLVVGVALILLGHALDYRRRSREATAAAG